MFKAVEYQINRRIVCMLTHGVESTVINGCAISGYRTDTNEPLVSNISPFELVPSRGKSFYRGFLTIVSVSANT
jgi:hypothetical protein